MPAGVLIQNSVQKIRQIIMKIPPAWRWALLAFFTGRVGLSLWGWIVWAIGLVPLNPNGVYYYEISPILKGPEAAWLGVWQRWDALHYTRIALNGYSSPDVTAFFPLYPLISRAISQISGLPVLVSLILVSNAALLLSLVILYQIVEEFTTTSLARRSLFCLVLFPTAFFFYAPYPQSLALLLILASFQSARKQHFFWAAAAGLAAGLTHSTVVPLVLVLALEAWKTIRSNRHPLRWATLLAAATPLMGTALFLSWRVSQGFPSLSKLLWEVWGRGTQWPWQALLDIPRVFQSVFFPISGWANLLFLVLALCSSVWAIRRLPIPLWVYQWTLLGFILSTTLEIEPLGSFNRYILLMFPTYLALGTWSRHSRLTGWLVFTTMAIMQLYLSMLFFIWGWVG